MEVFGSLYVAYVRAARGQLGSRSIPRFLEAQAVMCPNVSKGGEGEPLHFPTLPIGAWWYACRERSDRLAQRCDSCQSEASGSGVLLC